MSSLTVSTFSIWFWRQIALWAVILKREEIAIEYWARIHAARPGDIRALSSLAHLHADRGRRSHAIQLLEQAVVIDGQKSSVWFNLGFLLQEDGQHARAVPAFDQAIALDPKLDRAHYGKALSLIKLEQLQDALEPLRRNIELQPMSPYGFYQLAHLHHRLGQVAEAEKTIRHLAGFEPQVARQLERETGISAGLEVR
jgi:tetratricopeptide (TPR) repeat protein